MKRIALLTALMLLSAVCAFSQASRVDQPLLTSGPSIPTSGGALPQSLWVANSTVYLCTHPSATLAACQSNPITTYTDSTEATQCLSPNLMVQLPGNTCTSSSGVTANVGFWYGGGIVDYWVVSSYGPYGPFSVNAGTGGGVGCGTGTPCSIAQGGTAATGAAAALLNLGGLSATVSGVQVVGVGSNNNIQAAVTAAGTTGAVWIPASYAGTDTFTNPNNIAVYDYRLGAQIKTVIDLTDYGALGDLQQNSTGATSSTTVTTTGSPTFSAASVGKTISVNGGVTTIATYVSANQVTTNAAVGSGCSGSCVVLWGTDNTAAFNAAVAYSQKSNVGLGTEFFLPAGGYGFAGASPLVVPNGSIFAGALQSNTTLYDMGSVNANFITLGAGSGGTGGTTGVYGLGISSPSVTTGCTVGVGTAGNWEVEDSFFLSGGTAVCAAGVGGLIWGNVFDSSMQNFVVATGNGTDQNGTVHTVTVAHNLFYGAKNDCMVLNGVQDFLITENQFTYCYLHGIEGTTAIETSRLTITNNNFLTSASSSNYSSSQSHIFFSTSGAGGLTDSIIGNNTFSYSRNYDIALNGSGTLGDLIADNKFVSSSLASGAGSPLASIYISNVGSSVTKIQNNSWHNPAGYAVQAVSAAIHATGNDLKGVFNVSGVPGTASQSGAIWNSGGAATTSIVRDNTTYDTTYPAFSVSGAQAVQSSDNVSGYSSDIYSVGTATTMSANERMGGSSLGGQISFPTGITVTSCTGCGLSTPITLTTLGTSGAATYGAGTLNIPNYSTTWTTPGTIGSVTPSTGAFTQLIASSLFNLSGTATLFELNGSPGTIGQCPVSQGAGATPQWGNCGGTPVWSSILSPTANNSLTMAAYRTTFTYNATTGTQPMFLWQDTASNTGTGPLIEASTASGSAAPAAEFLNNGVGYEFINGQMQSVNPSTYGFSLPANSACIAGASGSVVYCTDSTNGYAEFNENNTGLSRACTAANGVCNTPTTLLATGIVDGKASVTVTTGTTATLGGTYKSGYTFNQEGTAATAVTYTLPTAAAGLQYCVANSFNGSAADTGALTIQTSAAGQYVIYTDGTLSASGGYVLSGGAARDSACVVGVDSTHWMLYVQSGTWAKH